MKKIFLILSFLFYGLSAVLADEFVVSRIGCSDAGTFNDREIILKYDDKEKVFYLYRSDFSRTYWYTLTPEKLQQLREIIKKAQDWASLAIEKKAAISKEIPDSSIRVPVTMKRGNDWYTSSYDLTLKFTFISTFDGSTSLTSLLIMGTVVSSKQNRYTELEFESVIFINTLLDKFADAISEESVNAAIEAQKKKQFDADMFN